MTAPQEWPSEDTPFPDPDDPDSDDDFESDDEPELLPEWELD